MNPRTKRLVALVLLFLVPWTVVVGRGGVQFVFLWGLANPATLHVVTIWDYLFVLTSGLPDRLLAWPASTLLFLAGVAAALWDDFGRGDDRLAAGFLLLAAVAHLGFVVGAASRGFTTPLPLGPALTALVVWRFFWPANWPKYGREQ